MLSISTELENRINTNQQTDGDDARPTAFVSIATVDISKHVELIEIRIKRNGEKSLFMRIENDNVVNEVLTYVTPGQTVICRFDSGTDPANNMNLGTYLLDRVTWSENNMLLNIECRSALSKLIGDQTINDLVLPSRASVYTYIDTMLSNHLGISNYDIDALLLNEFITYTPGPQTTIRDAIDTLLESLSDYVAVETDNVLYINKKTSPNISHLYSDGFIDKSRILSDTENIDDDKVFSKVCAAVPADIYYIRTDPKPESDRRTGPERLNAIGQSVVDLVGTETGEKINYKIKKMERTAETYTLRLGNFATSGERLIVKTYLEENTNLYFHEYFENGTYILRLYGIGARGEDGGQTVAQSLERLIKEIAEDNALGEINTTVTQDDTPRTHYRVKTGHFVSIADYVNYMESLEYPIPYTWGRELTGGTIKYYGLTDPFPNARGNTSYQNATDFYNKIVAEKGWYSTVSEYARDEEETLYRVMFPNLTLTQQASIQTDLAELQVDSFAEWVTGQENATNLFTQFMHPYPGTTSKQHAAWLQTQINQGSELIGGTKFDAEYYLEVGPAAGYIADLVINHIQDNFDLQAENDGKSYGGTIQKYYLDLTNPITSPAKKTYFINLPSNSTKTKATATLSVAASALNASGRTRELKTTIQPHFVPGGNLYLTDGESQHAAGVITEIRHSLGRTGFLTSISTDTGDIVGAERLSSYIQRLT